MTLDHARSMIADWVFEVSMNVHKSEYYGINVIERVLRDPGIAKYKRRHWIFWWPRSRRVALVEKAMHQIPVIQQICLLVQYRGVIREDGNVYTKHDLALDSSVTVREFNRYRKESENKIREILEGYERGVELAA